MTDVVVIKGEDDENVTREEAHEIAESHANDADERSAERDVHLTQMISDALAPLHDRITALETPVIEPEPEPVEEVVETVPETPAEDDVETAADASEADVDEITEEAEHETAPVVEDKEEDKDDKPAKPKRDRQPRQRRNLLTTMLGGSGGVRRGGK